MSNRLFQTPNDERSRDFAYWGDRGEWFRIAGMHRDSDLIERANFESFRRMVAELDPSETLWAIERYNHWAVGWVETLLVASSGGTFRMLRRAAEMKKQLEKYPIFDEELYSDLESQEVDASWKAYGAADLRRELSRYVSGPDGEKIEDVSDDELYTWFFSEWQGESEYDGYSVNFHYRDGEAAAKNLLAYLRAKDRGEFNPNQLPLWGDR